jgi:hypothetical protein
MENEIKDDLPMDLMERVRLAALPILADAKTNGWTIRMIHWHDRKKRVVAVQATSPSGKLHNPMFDEAKLPEELTTLFSQTEPPPKNTHR